MTAPKGYHVYRKTEPESWEQQHLETKAVQGAAGVFYQAEYTDVGIEGNAKETHPEAAQFLEHIEQNWERIR